MFDVMNLSASPITITGFAVRGLGNYSTSMNVYSLNTPGSFLTSTTNFNQAWFWTLRGSAPVTLHTAYNTELPIPFSVAVAPSTIQAFYITTTVPGTKVSYLPGGFASLNTIIASDGVLQVRAGVGKTLDQLGQPFGWTIGGPTPNISYSCKFRGTVRYQTGALPSWQTNSAASSFQFNGVNGAQCTKALTSLCAGNTVTATLGSNIAGTLFDVALSTMPSVANGSGALATGGGQLINLDLLGGLSLLNGSMLPHPGNMSIAFGAPSGLTVSAQQFVLDATHPDGLQLSQAAQLSVSALGGLGLPGPTGDDTWMTIVAGMPPYCAPALTFYGTVHNTYHVITNGRITWPTPSPSIAVSVASAVLAPSFCGLWSDYDTNAGGNITLDVAGGIVGVNYNAIAYFGQPGNGVLVPHRE